MPRPSTLPKTPRTTKVPIVLPPSRPHTNGNGNGNGTLPPHSVEAEAAAIGCVLVAAESGSQAEVDALLSQLKPGLFYDLRHRTIFESMRKLRTEQHAVDVVTVCEQLKRDKSDVQLRYLSELPDKVPTVLNFGTYLAEIRDYALRRWCINKTARLGELAKATNLTPDQLKEEFAEIYDQSAQIGASSAPMIRLVTPSKTQEYQPSPEDFMVGEGLISKGMIVTIGGYPGVGKSRLLMTLAIAGARGLGTWQGYPLKSHWRTVMLQTENDAMRLKEELASVPKELDEFIEVSDMLSHGLAFDNPEFRRELRRIYDQRPFDMLGLDPWNDVSFEDGQKDYKQALLNIKSVFRGIEKPPAIIIVSHLRKTGRDDNGKRKTGRQLLDELSGSLALGSSSRTVFAIQAATNAMDDDRITFEVAKANNCTPEYLKEHGTRSAWHRKNGCFERVAQFNWDEYDNPGEPERRAVTEEMVRSVLENETKGLKPAALAKALKKSHNVGESTAFRAIGEDGYLRHLLQRTGLGTLVLKEP